MRQRPMGVFPVAPVETWTTRKTRPAADVEEDLAALAHLQVRSAVAGTRAVRSPQPGPERRADASRAGKAVQLLERQDRLCRVVCVQAVDAAERKRELPEAALEDADARPAGALGQVGDVHGRAQRANDARELSGRLDGHLQDVVGRPPRGQAESAARRRVTSAPARGHRARRGPGVSPHPRGAAARRSRGAGRSCASGESRRRVSAEPPARPRSRGSSRRRPDSSPAGRAAGGTGSAPFCRSWLRRPRSPPLATRRRRRREQV